MEERKIKVLIKEPYKTAVVSEIVDDLKALQKIVGGYIEVIPFPTIKGVDLIVNEEGKIEKLDGNIFLPYYDDCVVGTCIIASYNEEGEFESLTEKQIKQVNDYIKNFEIKEGYDLYKDFELLDIKMHKRMKELNSEME